MAAQSKYVSRRSTSSKKQLAFESRYPSALSTHSLTFRNGQINDLPERKRNLEILDDHWHSKRAGTSNPILMLIYFICYVLFFFRPEKEIGKNLKRLIDVHIIQDQGKRRISTIVTVSQDVSWWLWPFMSSTFCNICEHKFFSAVKNYSAVNCTVFNT